MKAIIIAAGSGQRLDSETTKLPKGLLDINGKNILERQINLLKNKNIQDIIIITGPYKEKFNFSNVNYVEDLEYEKEKSVKAIALIRAYRIRGHLISALDPLGMMERKYLEDLHPADHGFKKEDYNKKIYVGEYMDKEYASINELLLFLRKTYCSTIGVEYMHISDPTEKIWFRERMEKKEKQLNFTDTGKTVSYTHLTLPTKA